MILFKYSFQAFGLYFFQSHLHSKCRDRIPYRLAFVVLAPLAYDTCNDLRHVDPFLLNVYNFTFKVLLNFVQLDVCIFPMCFNVHEFNQFAYLISLS